MKHTQQLQVALVKIAFEDMEKSATAQLPFDPPIPISRPPGYVAVPAWRRLLTSVGRRGGALMRKHPGAALGLGALSLFGAQRHGNALGARTGFNAGANEAMNRYSENGSGIVGALRGMGNAIGLVPDQRMFDIQ